MKTSSSKGVLTLPIHCIRNISCPEDSEDGRFVYAGHMPIAAVQQIPSHENVRGYLREAEGKERRMMTQVHRAILNTLSEHPSMFSVLNGGLVIVAKACDIDDKTREIRLKNPSIINGSQTQGVIKDFLHKHAYANNVHVKFELIITNDEDLIAEISIARNFQNDVESISIAGRRGQLDELEARLQQEFPDNKLRKSETQRPSVTNDYIDTEKLLQVLAALLPEELWWKPSEVSKTYTYSQRATCLKDFQRVFESAKNSDLDDHGQMSKVYAYYLDMASEAWKLYQKWKTHQGFTGTGIRSLEREGRTIVDVPDAIVFPVLAAHSEFVVNKKGTWTLSIPTILDDAELIGAAKSVYMEIAKSRPEIMGKTKACYSAIQQITSIYRKFANRAG
jgi:hypothetical protein